MGYMTLAFMLVCLVTLSEAWHNNYKKQLNYKCSNKEALNVVLSEFHKTHKDRRWYLACRPDKTQNVCKWTGYVTSFRQMIVFQCSGGRFINGMRSYFSSKYSDRRWNFLCCYKPKYHTGNCFYTSWKNYYTQKFFLFAAPKYYIRGVISTFNKYQRDRRFLYQLCPMMKN